MNTNVLLISGIYYVFVFFISLFSVFAVYLFIRYGRSIIIALAGSVIYSIIFLKLLSDSYQLLHTLIS